MTRANFSYQVTFGHSNNRPIPTISCVQPKQKHFERQQLKLISISYLIPQNLELVRQRHHFCLEFVNIGQRSERECALTQEIIQPYEGCVSHSWGQTRSLRNLCAWNFRRRRFQVVTKSIIRLVGDMSFDDTLGRPRKFFQDMLNAIWKKI